MKTTEKYILGIDAGSTGIKALLFDREGHVVTRGHKLLPVIHGKAGHAEYDPEVVWSVFHQLIQDILNEGYSPAEIAAIGISNQRATFCLWERATGNAVTPMSSWQDVRSADVMEGMNRNLKWKLLKAVAAIVSAITRNTMLTATSMLNITTDHASCRLKWMFGEYAGLLDRCRSGEIAFGTLDSWLVHKLTNGRNHVTDYTNASSTAMYDPFNLKWNGILCRIFGIPMGIFPEVLDTNGYFGDTEPSLTGGVPIPIHAVCGDQQSALFGHRCYKTGDVKISQGTGSFVDINVGGKGKLSRRGLFPLIAWVLKGRPTYMLEGFVATAGALIDWLGYGMGINNTPKALNEFAAQCDDSDGVIFIPTPAGIRFPFFNPRMRATVLGLSLSTHRRHVARAVLEGIALRVVDILDGIRKDTKVVIRSIKVDGGVSKSDIQLQCLADFADLSVLRAPEPDMTSTGAAYLAGLGSGFWQSLSEIETLNIAYDVFKPKMDAVVRKAKIDRWKKAVKAVLSVD